MTLWRVGNILVGFKRASWGILCLKKFKVLGGLSRLVKAGSGAFPILGVGVCKLVDHGTLENLIVVYR